MTNTAGLTEKTRKKLKETVDNIRTKLINDLYLEANRKFSFDIKDRTRLKLSPEIVYHYKLLSNWCNDSIRKSKDFQTNVKDLIKEFAYTLTNRLFILRQMEARGLQSLQVLTGGKESSGYKEFRSFCPELCQGSDEGYNFLLKQIFDKIALDLPAFFSNTGILHVFDISGPTLFWLVDQLNQKELSGAWTDDTTIGWLYQYWNDPDRTAVNDKIAGKGTEKGKVEANEIANATQLFTERYMVEWLLQNSLGTQWLAICEKNNWVSQSINTIENLERRREDWRTKLKNKEVFEDMAMPIESEEEERWKFYVKQEIPKEVIYSAPSTLKEVKVLDPACGSGHFLVYAFDLLYAFYQEEAKFNNTDLKIDEIVNNILAYNLHGIDIDPRAVQLAAASLYLKSKEKSPNFQASQINLVATDLGLGNLKNDDPTILEFVNELAKDNILYSESIRIIESLKGADYLGSLLQIDKSLSDIKKDILPLFELESKVHNTLDDKFIKAVKNFIIKHDKGDDLGVKTRAEQLAKGLRLIELLAQKYQVVCANPPYLSKSKCDEKIESIFNKGSELYEEFFYRFIDLVSQNGFIASLTAHNFMFISKFEELRKTILKDTLVYRCLHFGTDTFQDVLNALGFTALVQIKTDNFETESKYIRLEKIPMKLKRIYSLCSPITRQFTFDQSKFSEIEGSPMIYWWSEEFRQVYLKSPKIGESNVKKGMITSNNNRYLRNWWEIDSEFISLIDIDENDSIDFSFKWQPYLKGAQGRRWIEPLISVINWLNNGKDVKIFNSFLYKHYSKQIQNERFFFKTSIPFSTIGTNGFCARTQVYKSIFDTAGSSIFVDNYLENLFFSTLKYPII